VLEGEIRMEVELTNPGEQLEAALFSQGEIVRALAFVDVGMRVATAIANEPTEVLLWNKEDWKKLCEDEPQVGYQLAVRIAHELALSVRKWHIRLLNTVSWGLEG
jgi:CRP-like cAMP-binding protein